jgi:hypothetical protein
MAALVRAGDWLVLVAGGALVAGLGLHYWHAPGGETLIVRAHGQIHDRASLLRAAVIEVAGPLGLTRIEIQPGRARVARDPSPRQLCVKQGWLSHAGDAALCLPNEVSIEIQGTKRLHDSVAY